MSKPGRNDPCSCGSGRKFKHCCLNVEETEDRLRLRLRSAEGALIPTLAAYAVETFGREFFEEAWEEFFLWDLPENEERAHELGTTFDPFFVCEFVPDTAEDPLPEGWPTQPVALHYLQHSTDAVSDLDREFIAQACRSPASFFAVEALVPGRTLDLKDILTGRRFQVLEQSASRTLHVGDLLYTRIVTADGGSIMIGASQWIIPPSWHIPIIDMRNRLRRKRPLTRDELRDYSMEIRDVYHDIVDRLLQPRPPRLHNTDGDPLELTTLTYELGVPVAEAVDRLTPLATLHGTVHLDDEARDETGALVSATLTWLKSGNRKMKDWDNTTLGTLRFEGATLTVEINSARRSRKIQKEISKRLGAAATLVDTQVTDVEDVLAQRLQGGPAMPAERESHEEPPRPAEFQAIEETLARQHWETWPDVKIPALGNRTPRQAARTPAGRERLEALLVQYASRRSGTPALAPDIGALRQVLGLDRVRRA